MIKFIFILLLSAPVLAQSQKVDTIFFNLYTDSLKRGVFNYINVDGKLTNGNFLPLMSDEIILSSTVGRWEGNSLVIDTCNRTDSVIITAILKARPEVRKSVAIYIKKNDYQPPLKTEKELLDEWTKKGKKKN